VLARTRQSSGFGPRSLTLKIVIFGLSITSSWGNGHATTYRALTRALHRRGHSVLFFERDLEWYASNRDMPEPPFCRVQLYDHWSEVLPTARKELADADLAVVGSYFPDGIAAAYTVLDSRAEVKAFYDIDTPITASRLRSDDCEYLRRDQASRFDLYFSFTGGSLLQQLESEFQVRKALPLYCSFDAYRCDRDCAEPRFSCDLSYMGTYAADRQEKLGKLLCAAAQRLKNHRFLVAGPQYPAQLVWPDNVKTIVHLEPRFHSPFYRSSRMTLNLTRKEMVDAGYSPSVRLFEAAGCGTPILSDYWKGIETFFAPENEIAIVRSTDEVVQYLTQAEEGHIREMGRRAQERVMSEHTSDHRAIQLEQYLSVYATPMHR
jgi:spore maturation protein CgeB